MLCSRGGADQMLNKRTDGQIMDVECVEGRVSQPDGCHDVGHTPITMEG